MRLVELLARRVELALAGEDLAQLPSGVGHVRVRALRPPDADHLAKERLGLVLAALVREDLGDVVLGEADVGPIAGPIHDVERPPVQLERLVPARPLLREQSEVVQDQGLVPEVAELLVQREGLRASRRPYRPGRSP